MLNSNWPVSVCTTVRCFSWFRSIYNGQRSSNYWPRENMDRQQWRRFSCTAYLALFLFAPRENTRRTCRESIIQRFRDPLLLGSATILAASKMFIHGTDLHSHDRVCWAVLSSFLLSLLCTDHQSVRQPSWYWSHAHLSRSVLCRRSSTSFLPSSIFHGRKRPVNVDYSRWPRYWFRRRIQSATFVALDFLLLCLLFDSIDVHSHPRK